ncbi:hypothetical protein FF125_06355 [Aureibaculum algae]|uniref:Lipocalin-like domain-containing protein n=1 Tax=Aureibaculum algae TaxID=2584122 RepID=A0A5B7TSG3_9FLAO|nr:hypothetical protein [Aureibaculum algae]QCX38066.1 hypothetical protein FF125_06355 [Aureibaculum algae]
MKIKKLLPFIFGLIFTTISCSSDDVDLNPNYPSEFINTWLESYEESYGIYRPSDYKIFPESIYRQSYTFMINNECEYLVLSPVDAHYIEKGYWEYIEKDNVINIYNPDKELFKKLKVTSIAAELLQIE